MNASIDKPRITALSQWFGACRRSHMIKPRQGLTMDDVRLILTPQVTLPRARVGNTMQHCFPEQSAGSWNCGVAKP
ncbi:hypothetical protein BDN71DRAFT_1447981 [Pleurotus eryngii]|uniref:Uncharacterized protein n=1 Tax=Pleurotus eryngii TaxID=5323 RepID=A0A9P6D6X3_PLEER|nr:hypothetical protein BDN71DRAFT_1447981 [Pleurotus eryngii]